MLFCGFLLFGSLFFKESKKPKMRCFRAFAFTRLCRARSARLLSSRDKPPAFELIVDRSALKQAPAGGIALHRVTRTHN